MDNFIPLLYIYECSKNIVTFHDKNFISRNTTEVPFILGLISYFMYLGSRPEVSYIKATNELLKNNLVDNYQQTKYNCR